MRIIFPLTVLAAGIACTKNEAPKSTLKEENAAKAEDEGSASSADDKISADVLVTSGILDQFSRALKDAKFVEALFANGGETVIIESETTQFGAGPQLIMLTDTKGSCFAVPKIQTGNYAPGTHTDTYEFVDLEAADVICPPKVEQE